jgi:hypothetical protein
VFYRAIGLAVLLPFAAGAGIYLLGIVLYPRGFLQLSLLQYSLEGGLIIAAFYAPKVALVAICAAAIVAFVPQLAGVGRAFVTVRYRWPCTVVAAIGILMGYVVALHLLTSDCC